MTQLNRNLQFEASSVRVFGLQVLVALLPVLEAAGRSCSPAILCDLGLTAKTLSTELFLATLSLLAQTYYSIPGSCRALQSFSSLPNHTPAQMAAISWASDCVIFRLRTHSHPLTALVS